MFIDAATRAIAAAGFGVMLVSSLLIYRYLKQLGRDQIRAMQQESGRFSIAGLLARIAYMLASANINVASAKINTLGERAEDVFLIDGARLHDESALLRLETALYEQLRLM